MDTVPERLSPVADATAGSPRECLTLRLGAEEYGIDILGVQEIRSYEEPVRIAGAPAHVKGVVNLRGVIVPVVDLRLKLGLAEAGLDALTVVIVVNVRGRTVGLVADAVREVVRLAPEQVRPAPPFSSAVEAAWITGLGAVKDGDRERLIILVDLAALVAECDVAVTAPAS